MTEQEYEIKQQLAIQDAKFAVFMEELKQQREDMRRAREKHDADMRHLHERRDAMQAKHDADMRHLHERQDAMQVKHDAEMQEMNKKIDDNFKTLSNQIHNNFVQTMIGVGAIMAAIGGIIIAALK